MSRKKSSTADNTQKLIDLIRKRTDYSRIVQRAGLIGIGTAAAYIFILGVITAVLPNPWFARMTTVSAFDFTILITSGLLIGVYVSLHIVQRTANKACDISTTTGGIGSFLAFGCSNSRDSYDV